MEFWNVLYLYIAVHSIRIGVIDSRFCNESRNTLNVVQSCPTSEAEVNERAKEKNCESLAKSQNCSTPSKFKYHCVIDAKEIHLVEVCAPVYFMLGYCAEYNVEGARIQDHYKRKCTEYSPPCPNRYISTDAYQVTGCYELVQGRGNSTPSTSLSAEITTLPTIDTASKNDVFMHYNLWIVSVAVLVVIILIISALYYFQRRKGKLLIVFNICSKHKPNLRL
ncbi:uncharacterized protein LOC125674363 [Ostrea edulis]|uniref:uncharacterized protein LOC125674363 n=1 Tax=Ostrea edulis TaxID=37623 RepID=UPI0024AEF6CE|nr:uncharacterized protein LOC125674363 [Ostrea edulis]